MCLAIFKPKNKLFPDELTLRRAWKNNPDGAGLAICTDEGVQIIKGLMTFDDFFSLLDNSLIPFDVIIHFRWATSGNVDASMTHPFPVSNDNKDLKSLEILTEKAIIHNGVLFSPKFSSGYSDTAIFTRYLALKGINYDKIHEIIKSDRLAICSSNGVELLGQWHDINGVFYSNLYSIENTYKNNFRDPYFYSDDFFDLKSYDDDLDFCPCCGSDEVEHIASRSLTFECLSCGTIYNDTHFLETSFIQKPKFKKG